MRAQSLLWILQRPGRKPSWLFGTMHIRDDRAYQLCERLYPFIMEADAFIGEMDLRDLLREQDIPQYNIHEYLSERKYQKLKGQLSKSFRLNIDQFNHLHPLMIMGIISTSVLQSEHLVSLDEHLWKYATSEGKETAGLETYEAQVALLHSIDPVPIYKQLFKISRNPSGVRKNSLRGLDMYLSGRIHDLYILSKSSMQKLRKKVIYERNHHMASIIDHLDANNRYFITVGAGHLSGKSGLLSLLRKAGWIIKPVRLTTDRSEGQSSSQ